jgi:hypothetical protein
MNSYIQPTVKVGDTIEYYVPKAGLGDPYNICKGNVTSILPSEYLEVMMDIHYFVDRLVPIASGRPIRFEKGEWFDSNNCNCIVGDDTSATIGHVRRILGRFFIFPKGLRNNSMHLISLKQW